MTRRIKTVTAALLVAIVGASPLVAHADQGSTQTAVVSANPVDTTPFILNGRADAVAKIGNRIYIGGSFTQMKNWQGSAPLQTRNYLFAYNATTGLIDTGFNPVLNNGVLALSAASDGSGLFVGGKFSIVNGVARSGLVKLDPATGATVAAFKGNSGGGWVTDIDAASNGKLYVIGSFNKLRSVARSRLGAVDQTTGALDPDLDLALGGWQAVGDLFMQEYRLDVSADGAKMMIVGNFSTVGGQPRTQVAQIDLSTSPDSVVDWSTDKYPFCTCLKTDVNDVEIDPTGTYAIVVAGWPPIWSGDTPVAFGDHAVRWELASRGAVSPTWWNSSPQDTFTSVAISGTAVYVGGHFKSLNGRTSTDSTGAVKRTGLGALDPTTGAPMSWNPGRDRGWGVIDMLVTDDQLIIVHDTKNVGGEYHPRLAAFPLAGGSTPPPVQLPNLPVQLRRLPATGTDVSGTSFDGAAFGAPAVIGSEDWSSLRGAFVNGTALYAGSADGKLYRYSWNGTTWVSPADLTTRADAYGPTPINFADVSAMAFDGAGILYTRSGQAGVWWRSFNLESGIIGGYEHAVTSPDFARASSMFVLGGQLYVAWGAGASKAGVLSVYSLSGRSIGATSSADISGPAIDGLDWSNGEVIPVGL